MTLVVIWRVVIDSLGGIPVRPCAEVKPGDGGELDRLSRFGVVNGITMQFRKLEAVTMEDSLRVLVRNDEPVGRYDS